MICQARTIVVAVRDEINGRRALRRALTIAHAEAGSLHLVHARRLGKLAEVAEMLQPPWPDADAGQEQAGNDWLAALAAEARAQGHAVECAVLSGTPGTAVAEYAREAGADLIVVASPRAGLAHELFLGSSALRILRSATCPVLVARNDPERPYRCALVAVNNDEVGGRVVATAGALFSEAQIELAHAYLVPEEYKLRMRGVSEEAIADLRRAKRPDVERDLQAFARQLPQATLHVEHGFPMSVLLERFNQMKPDVLVIGKHSGSALDERVMGSVTQFLLYACNTDFLLVA